MTAVAVTDETTAAVAVTVVAGAIVVVAIGTGFGPPACRLGMALRVTEPSAVASAGRSTIVAITAAGTPARPIVLADEASAIVAVAGATSAAATVVVVAEEAPALVTVAFVATAPGTAAARLIVVVPRRAESATVSEPAAILVFVPGLPPPPRCFGVALRVAVPPPLIGMSAAARCPAALSAGAAIVIVFAGKTTAFVAVMAIVVHGVLLRRPGCRHC